MKPAAPVMRSFAEIQVGDRCAVEYSLSSEIYRGFLLLFDDRNPLHLDDTEAQRSGFERKVMHGGILNGFISHFVGMHLPGKLALLLSTEISFLQPCYEGDQLRIDASVDQKLESHQILVLKFLIERTGSTVPIAKGRIQVRMRDEKK